jgi:predicted acyl esterase
MHGITKTGASILNYKGSNGRLRASMRHLDDAHSSDEIPAHSFDRIEKLAPGEVVALDIDMFPVGLILYPGEQLRLIVTGHNIVGGAMPMVENVQTCNHGRHIIHTGGDRASYLQLPVKSAK